MPIYYEIQLDKEEVDNDRMVITNPDDIPVLLLHDIVTDDWYRNIDRQNEYEKREPNFTLITNVKSTTLNPLAHQLLLPNPSDHQLAPRATTVNLMDQLLQNMNNLKLAMSNNAPNQSQESKIIKFPTFSDSDKDLLTWLNEFDEAC
ncbi:19014_t:CDS:2, partial [Gigaspora margarita]